MFTLAYSLADDKVRAKSGFATREDALAYALVQYRRRRAEGWKFTQIANAKSETVATPETFDAHRRGKRRAV